MVMYPEVLKRAHEELDRVVGKDTLPTIVDREGLPYISAIIQESLRSGPIFCDFYDIHNFVAGKWSHL